MTGCRHEAKNTLLKNYLYLADRGGAEVYPLTTVTSIRPRADSRYEVTSERTTGWVPEHRAHSSPRMSYWQQGRWAPRSFCPPCET